MSTLRQDLLRLASDQPSIRQHVVPLLREATEKQAADEVDVSNLPREALALARSLGLRVEMAWHGIHGYIMETAPGAVDRFTDEDLKKLLAHPRFRWLSPRGGRGGWSIGV